MKYFVFPFYFLTFTFSHVSTHHSISFNQNSLELQSAIDFANFLRNYNNSLIVFHVDFQSLHYINSVIISLNVQHNETQLTSSVKIFNHDTLNTEFVRTKASLLVHVLMSNNSKVCTSLNSPTKISQNDVVVFVGWQPDLQETIRKDALGIIKLAGNTLLYKLSNESNDYFVYRTCYYCGNWSTKFQLLLDSTSNNVNMNTEDILPLNLRNLNGHLLHAVFIQYYPFVYCIDKKPNTTVINGAKVRVCNNVRGIEGKLLQTISEKLNFTFLVHTPNSSASFFDMIMHINASRADIAFGGVSMNEERLPYVQFTKQYNFEGYVFLYVLKWTFEVIFDKFIEPFRGTPVWILYITSFIAFSCLVHMIRKIRMHVSGEESSFGSALWLMLHMPFEQSVYGIGTKVTLNPSIFMVMSIWWWSSMIICTLYKSSILSAMVLPLNTEPENLEQLIMDGYRFAGNLHYADIIKELLHVNDPMYKEAYEKITYGVDACSTFEKILVGGVALLDELSEIQYELRSICPVPDESITSRFRTTRKIIRHTGHAWALQNGAPYRQALDYYLSLILSGGLFKKWTRDETRHLEAHQIPKSRSISSEKATGLSLVRLTPVLVIYLVGILIAVSCFLGEIAIFHLRRRFSGY